MDIPLALTFLAPSLFLLLWNLKLLGQNLSLKKELYDRECWHARELAKWRERL